MSYFFTSKEAYKRATFAIQKGACKSVSVSQIREAVAKAEGAKDKTEYMDWYDQAETNPFENQELVNTLLHADYGGAGYLQDLAAHLFNSDWPVNLSGLLSSLDEQHYEWAMQMIRHYKSNGENDPLFMSVSRQIILKKNHDEAFNAGFERAKSILSPAKSLPGKPGITEQEFDLEVEISPDYYIDQYTSDKRRAFNAGANHVKRAYIQSHPEWEGTEPDNPYLTPFRIVSELIDLKQAGSLQHDIRNLLARVVWAISKVNSAEPEEMIFRFKDDKLNIYNDEDEFINTLMELSIIKVKGHYIAAFDTVRYEPKSGTVVVTTLRQLFSFIKNLRIKGNPVLEDAALNELIA